MKLYCNGCGKLWSSGSREISHSAVCWSCPPEYSRRSCSSHEEARNF